MMFGKPFRILIVGPDGTGKSTVADDLNEALLPCQTIITHVKQVMLRPRSTAGSAPSFLPRRSSTVAMAKLLLFWMDYQLSFRIAARIKSLDCHIVERGWHDQVADPARYRYPNTVVPAIEFLGRSVPRYDLVVNLHGPAEAIVARKNELTVAEVIRQQAFWRERYEALGREAVEIDTASQSRSAVTEAITSAIISGSKVSSPTLASRRLGMVLIGPAAWHLGSELYQSKWRIVSRSFRAKLSRQTVLSREQSELLQMLRDRNPGLSSAVIMKSSTTGRLVATASGRGGRRFVKWGSQQDIGLENEIRALRHLQASSCSVVVPRIEDDWGGRGDRVYYFANYLSTRNQGKLRACELADLVNQLRDGEIGTHGDLAPWNVGRMKNGAWAVWDWECWRADAGGMFDAAHYVVQAGALMGHYTPSEGARLLEAVASSVYPDLTPDARLVRIDSALSDERISERGRQSARFAALLRHQLHVARAL